MSVVLVVNSGSSSIKYQIIDMDTEAVIAKGLIERIGTGTGIVTHTGPQGKHRHEQPILDHVAGFRAMVDACNTYGPRLDEVPIAAVGHRVVQGGSRFVAPTVIDDAVIRTIEEISPLAPLHNPPNLLGITAARATFPDVPHVAIFDTAFHRTLPEEAHTYAIDANLARQYRIRRYGFHGTSHKYVAELAADYLGRPLAEVNAITLHIGNGVSACAVRGGESVDTSMGMTPLEGLMMGTRSGDLDPGILFHLHRQAGMTVDQLDDMLNRRSGLLGMTGSSDMRDVLESAHRGEKRAELALATYCYRLKGYVGAYFAHLGQVDAIVFTAGVGENAPEVRHRTLEGLEHLGIRLDETRNEADESGTRCISADDSAVAVLVIPTNEELEIARQTLTAIA
ncbi:MAG TPA: acetate kinase [Thermomicrobiales bacterium]|nr:acetate kinase [Thermomicrobiales bacterium]